MDFAWSAELEALAAEARALGAPVASTRAHREESWVVGFDRAFSRELGRRGWLGMTWPACLGGGERSALERFVVTEALLSVGAPIAASWVGDRQIGPTLIAHGSQAQLDRYLPPMIAGDVTWCIGMSEPDAGSDLASVRTRARRLGDAWVINGRKTWTSFAEQADHCYLVARTGDEASGHQGLSEFIVDMASPGIEISPIADITGEHHFAEVTFDGVTVSSSQLVGTEGESWRQLMGQLEHERAGVDRLLSNRALYDETLATLDTADANARQVIARLESDYFVGRLLVLREILGQAPRSFSAATKVFCTEHQQRVAEFVLASNGPAGMLAGRAARASAYSPAYTIQGGTSAILRTVLAERVLGLPREPAPPSSTAPPGRSELRSKVGV